MTAKKRTGRIRQTRNDWQKVFDKYPGMVKPVSWSDRLPEVLHISMALIDNEYDTVKADFYRVGEFVQVNSLDKNEFFFNLSHALEIIKSDRRLLDEIFRTCFRPAFENILAGYGQLFEIEVDFEFEARPDLLFRGFSRILDGRSDISILCKYMMMQYRNGNSPDPARLFGWESRIEILKPENVSSIMAMFPPSIGISKNLNLEFCEEVWLNNYIMTPHIPRVDDSKIEEQHFEEMQLSEFENEFRRLYDEFKQFNLVAVFPRNIAEINMGFASRISSLSLDVVEFVRVHKGETAEIILRTALENFIVGSWLLKKEDFRLYQRFSEYKIGRDRFFAEKLIEKAENEELKNKAKEWIRDDIKSAGVREIQVASERGDVFDIRIDQMATEVWGDENKYYYIYKRLSEVTHVRWGTIAKYHLSKSRNPMHNGLYTYNENPNRFAGLVPAFVALGISSEFLANMLSIIDVKEAKDLAKRIVEYHKRVLAKYLEYFNKYVVESSGDQ